MDNIRKAGSHTVAADSKVAKAIDETHGFSKARKRLEERRKKQSSSETAKPKGGKS